MIDLNNFSYHLHQLCPAAEEKKFLLAVSGGADSMVLLHLFLKSALAFEVSHVNYHLREEDSNLDQALVEEFCKKNKISFHSYNVSEKDLRPSGSIELWARELRYRFFRKILKEKELDYLVTAHHLNDQLETFIINLSRGSGIRGLAGIPAKENQILRPLLHCSKEEIYTFAKENAIPFREDYTNHQTDFLRNKIRNEIVPLLLKTNAHFLENFDKSINFLGQTKEFLAKKVTETFENITQEIDGAIHLDKEKLSQLTPLEQYEVLKKFGITKSLEINKLLKAQTGSQFFSEKYRILVNRNEIICTLKDSKPTIEDEVIEIPLPQSKTNYTSIQLREYISYPTDSSQKYWQFDLDKLSFPLLLRRKKAGDFFSPPGMMGKKKVSKFLKDEKLSIFAKEKVWLLTDFENRVLGIVPFRQDGRFISTEDSKSTLCVIL